ncbi:MAG: hypothetical protein K2M46_14455 [Lachnospiraceae bacterium]|nr:hypothetical protein [Lachnospiraceae bacterium]
MHIKHMHEMIEKMAEYCKCDIEKGYECLDLKVVGPAIDILKDLCEAEYYAKISKAMDKAEEEDKEEEKYMLKRFKEEYGEEDGEKRFYDDWRYASGRFAPKGRGSYEPRRSERRRGYVEPPYYHMMPEMYDDYSAEEMRDLDRKSMNRMYYTPMSGNSGNMGGNSRGYSDGYDEGQKRGYSEGYEQGNRDGRRNGGNSRYDNAKRGYEETKEMHKGNTPEDKQVTMREAEKMVNVFMDGLEEALEDSPIEVKNMVKTKATSRLQKMS